MEYNLVVYSDITFFINTGSAPSVLFLIFCLRESELAAIGDLLFIALFLEKKSQHRKIGPKEWHKRCKSYRKDDIIGDAEQIQLTNMRDSAVELRVRGKELHCTGEQICQLDLRGIADYRSLPIGFAMLDNLRFWQDNHLHTIE